VLLAVVEAEPAPAALVVAADVALLALAAVVLAAVVLAALLEELVAAAAFVVDDWVTVVAVGLLLPQAVMSAPTPPMPINPEKRRNVRRDRLRLARMSVGSMTLLSPPIPDSIIALPEPRAG